jgi:hypothetical protein
MSSKDLKDKIEATYKQDERTVDAGVDHAGQMTVAFCEGHLTNYDQD